MKRSSVTGLAVSAVVFGMAGLASAQQAPASPASLEELSAQVRALQARVQELEGNRLTTADVDATVRKVIADADQRSQVFDSSQFRAGWDPKLEKFVVGSADGNWTASPIIIWQFRGIGQYRDDPLGTDRRQSETGFENRRARFGLEGTAATKDLTYRFLWESSRTDGSVQLLDAYARYKFLSDWSVRAGQFKDPWTQEENMSDAKQLAVERSMMNALIGGAIADRVQGVALSYDSAKPLRAQFVVHDGANSKDSPFTDNVASGNTGLPTTIFGPQAEQYGLTGRVEYFVFGTPRQYEDYSALGNKDDLLVVGAGADWTQGGGNDALFHAVDIQYENASGLGLFGEYMGLSRDIASGSATTVPVGNYYDFGFLAQIGYVFAPKWEVFGRADWVQLDSNSFASNRATTNDQVYEFTVGVNYYLYKHNAKITVDLNYLPNGSPDLPGLGYLATDDNSFVLRTQLQLAL
jgi:hypothetical protein